MRTLLALVLTLTLVGPGLAQGDVTLTIHYHRADAVYTGWGIHLWDAIEMPVESGRYIVGGVEYSWSDPLLPTGVDDWGVLWEIPIVYPDEQLGFIIHNGDNKDPGPDQFWGDYDAHPEFFIDTATTEIYTEQPDPGVRLLSAISDGDRLVDLTLVSSASDLDAFSVLQGDDEQTVTSRVTTNPTTVRLTLADPIDITLPYTARDAVGGNEVPVRHRFDDEVYGYDGDDLGCTWTATASTFKLWSPVAASAAVVLYDSPYPVDGEVPEVYAMARAEDDPGVLQVAVSGDHRNRYYLYRMSVYGEDYDTPDLYSVALGSNSRRSMIVDLDATDPEGWAEDTWPTFDKQESIIYELHVRDVTAGEDWNGTPANRGKFLGVVEPGTRFQDEPTGFDHILDLGVNTVQILPMYDFSSVEENNPDSRNWGYDPYAYNAPEGSYSSDPDDGRTRIREMKQMIQAFHAAGIKVVMDVVYNHTHNVGPQGSLYDAMVPKYYYRLETDGSYSNGSGVGNEVATEKIMARRFIKQSCRYWVEEFHVDGFRFDLMGLMDTDIMAEITAEITAINPHAIIYGEPWGGYGATILTGKGDQRGLGFGCFNDNIRNGIRGSTDGTNAGFAMGALGNRPAVLKGVDGAITDFTDGPDETINYISAHDNYTWWDYLDYRWNPRIASPLTEAELIGLDTFGNSIVLLSQGIPFLHAGVEFLRTKRTGDPDQEEEAIRNSYNQGDDVNQLDWSRRAQYDDTVDYYRGLIALRRARPELRLPTKEAIEASQNLLVGLDGGVIAYTLDDATPGDGWGDLMVVHNPSTEPVDVPLPGGQWALVVDAQTAGLETLAQYTSTDVAPITIEAPPRGTLVLRQQTAPPLQLNIFQNATLDRFLHFAVNARDGSTDVELRINGAVVALTALAENSWISRYEFAGSGPLEVVLTGGGSRLVRNLSVWSLDGGTTVTSPDGVLELSVPAGARPGGWLVLADRVGRPDLPADSWLLGAAGARLQAAAVLRIRPTATDQVIQVHADGLWRSLATTVGADGRLEARTDQLGLVRLAAGEVVPSATRLLGNVPNPFNPGTSIRFDLAVGTEHPILIAADGAPVGVVTKRALLRGIQGREETTQPQAEAV